MALFIWTIQDVCGLAALLGFCGFILLLVIMEHHDK